MAKPSEAADPANPIKCPEPTFDAKRDAPTYENKSRFTYISLYISKCKIIFQ